MYIIYYYINILPLEIDPLQYLFGLDTERLKVITKHDSSVNTNGPRMVYIKFV